MFDVEVSTLISNHDVPSLLPMSYIALMLAMMFPCGSCSDGSLYGNFSTNMSLLMSIFFSMPIPMLILISMLPLYRW